MDRRSYLALAAAAVTVGCSSDNSPTTIPPNDGTGQAGPDPVPTPTTTPRPSLALSATDSTVSNPDVSLTVQYDHTQTERLPTDPPTAAEATYTWLMVRTTVVNTGDTPRELTSYQYVVDAESETYEPLQLRANWRLAGQRVQSGETATGWLVFHIPDYATEATLRVRDATQQAFEIVFEQERSLDTTLPQ